MFLENLEMLMNARGLNKHSFSQQSGIPYKTIDNFWKKGCDNVKLTTLKRIASFFGVTLDYLIFGNKRSKGSIDITEHEQNLIIAYRSHPDMQTAINKMLDIAVDCENVSDKLKQKKVESQKIISFAARNGKGGTIELNDEQAEKLQSVLESDFPELL